MTAIKLLLIYYIIMMLIGLICSVNAYCNSGLGTTRLSQITIGEWLYLIGINIFHGALGVGLGIIFICLASWVMAQFGVIVTNALVYAVIYVVLSLFKKFLNRG